MTKAEEETLKNLKIAADFIGRSLRAAQKGSKLGAVSDTLRDIDYKIDELIEDFPLHD